MKQKVVGRRISSLIPSSFGQGRADVVEEAPWDLMAGRGSEGNFPLHSLHWPDLACSDTTCLAESHPDLFLVAPTILSWEQRAHARVRKCLHLFLCVPRPFCHLECYSPKASDNLDCPGRERELRMASDI